MRAVVIESDALRLRVLPRLGAGMHGLSLRRGDGEWRPLLRASPDLPEHFNSLACYLLAPWSNRVRGGKFRFAGREHAMRPDWPDGTAIHGLVKDKAWRILDRSPVSVRLAFNSRDHAPTGYPAAFSCVARYELDGATFRASLAVTIDDGAVGRAPVGLGFHPFFPRRLWDERDEVVVACRASGPDAPRGLRGRYPCEGMLPVGQATRDGVVKRLCEGTALGGEFLDDVFAGSLDGAVIEWRASGVRVVFACSPGLDHTVIYAGHDTAGKPLPFFCAEPVSMVNDGFNMLAEGLEGTGVRVLEPGGSFEVEWAMHVECV
ncbi:MAG: hypothetical protein AMXMBFR77_15520 [Phycisphaerales bacterium]|nr:hypothetical protein [Phycisphaerales bacterium]MDL1904395.1 hypothetical protein [Synechococcales cyanobacterium CNB]GIK19105.1 MAG: aldose 1-epimerase [Planctomycetota bacterium]